jgi:hypothetical protein
MSIDKGCWLWVAKRGEGNTYYSFLTVFTPVVVRPTEEERDDQSLIRM